MTHHYKHQWQRPDIKELALIREIIAFGEVMQPLVNPVARGRLDLRLSETKLLYSERTGRPYIPLPEQFDMGQMEETR